MADFDFRQFPSTPTYHPVPAFQQPPPYSYPLTVPIHPTAYQTSSSSSKVEIQENKASQINYTELEKTLRCPILLEPFKDPVFIPECGHTFDRKALIGLIIKKCPICNHYFKNDPLKFRVNWIVASLLNLNIPRPTQEDILAYDAEMARVASNKAIATKVDRILTYFLKQIKLMSELGKKDFDYEFDDIPEANYIQAIVDELKVRGYCGTVCYKTLSITW